jgi:L-cysteine/cystine lyase
MTEHCRAALAERFEVLSSPGQGTLVAWRSNSDPRKLVASLYERGVVVRDIPGRELLRASCGWWTDESDIERLLAALIDICR